MRIPLFQPPVPADDRLAGADIGFEVARARDEVRALQARLDRLARRCADERLAAALVAVDGPFAGDAPAALDATRLWLGRATGELATAAGSLAEAHVTAGGLASR